MTPVDKVLNIFRGELGYLEKASNKDLDSKTANAGHNNWTKYARDLDNIGYVYNGKKNGHSWCDVFYDWPFVQAFGVDLALQMLYQPKKSCGAGCIWSARYYQENGAYFYSNPQPGDQIFFGPRGDEYHTGVVEAVKDGVIYTIEGNTSAGTTVVANGGGVARKSYSINNKNISGYGRPNWSLVAKRGESSVTLDEFKKLYHDMRKELQDNDSSSYSDAAKQWATSTGLIQGNGTVVNGQPNYMWEDVLTREQFVTVLHRFAQLMGKA